MNDEVNVKRWKLIMSSIIISVLGVFAGAISCHLYWTAKTVIDGCSIGLGGC